MANLFETTLRAHGLGALHRGPVETLQINVGKLCNQTCVHCHVNAGPGRREVMTRATLDKVLDWLAATAIAKVDITGGAPELNPHFRHLVGRVRSLTPRRTIIDRCNLTVFFEPGQEDLPDYLARHELEIIASLPCYSRDNVEAQRGSGVFDKSIRALQVLNRLGYGTDPRLPLHLVYNPNGAFLPGPQAELEADYKAALRAEHGIEFNRLLTITNMPIARFAAWLRQQSAFDRYQDLLVRSFNPAPVAGLMCRTTLSVGWQGEVYDCDFNQMLDLAWTRNGDRPPHVTRLWELDPRALDGRAIMTGHHCFGCTAGAGSSCGGALAG